MLATLAYRLVSYWLPIPFGALAYGFHRRFAHDEEPAETFRELGQHEIDHPDERIPTS